MRFSTLELSCYGGREAVGDSCPLPLFLRAAVVDGGLVTDKPVQLPEGWSSSDCVRHLDSRARLLVFLLVFLELLRPLILESSPSSPSGCPRTWPGRG